jgi:hypothetical protein
MVNKILVLVFIFFCFELGIFLIIFPWSQYWDNNFFLFHLAFLRPLVLNNYFRGAVAGLGVVDLALGFWEATNFKATVRMLDQKTENHP